MKALSVASFAALLVLAAAPARSADPPPLPSGDRVQVEKQRERLLERLRAHGVAVPSASGAPARPQRLPAPSGSSGAVPIASGGALREELSRKWRALSESRIERRERHRAALLRELGQRLSDPRVKEELRLHATRVAELGRIQFLAENSRTGAHREKLLERITELSARETARHRTRLAALAGARAMPSGSVAVPPAPSTAPSGGGQP